MPTTVANYTNLPGTMGGPLSLRRSGQSRFALPDLQGNVRQLTDSTQTVTDTLTTDAFGVQKASSGSTVNPYKAFGGWGYFTDTPSRLYVRLRHLRVDLGGWLSRDPAEGPWNRRVNIYSIVDPINHIDPSGAIQIKPAKVPEWRVGDAPPPSGCCGLRKAWYEYKMPGKHCDGYVVQKVDVKRSVYQCGGWYHDEDMFWHIDIEYYEAWHYGEDKPHDDNYSWGNYTDQTYNPSIPDRYGFEYTYAEARFYCSDTEIPILNFRGGECERYTGIVPCMDGPTPPPFWNRPPKTGGSKTRQASSNWGCCPGCRVSDESHTYAQYGPKQSSPVCP